MDLHFPRVLYKRLTGREVGLADLREVAPALHRGLQQLLEYDDADGVQAAFGLSFQARALVKCP